MLQRPRNFMRTLACFGVFLTGGLCPALAGDPTGDWNVKDGVANIRVAECNGSMWGAVVWEKIQGGRDKNNPDPAKVSRPTLGMLILFDMKRTTGADQWNGKVYNAKDGQTYDASIKLLGPDELAIEGCVLGFLCGGETWSRVGPPIPSSPSNLKGAKARAVAGVTRSTAPSAPTKPPAPAAKASASTTTGQSTGAQSADPVGDICLLPELAGLAH
jgi:uncharacterized protein (DUF2147 family)